MKILSKPRGNAEEYGRWSVNPYVGCPHGCSYCYLKKGVWTKELGGNVPRLKKGIIDENHAFHLAMVEILENKEQIIKDDGLFMTFTSDPMVDVCRDLFFKIAIDAIQYKIPIVVLTKATKFWNSDEYFNLCAISKFGFQSKRYVSFGWTLTGHDELEPNAPSNKERLRDMEIVRDEGFKVWASIEPVIDFPSSLDMIYQALNAGCRHFKIGLLTSNTKPCREKYHVHDCLDFIEKVMVATEGRATVYWKQSVRDYIRTSRKPALTDDELHKVFDTREHSVDSHWSMFK